MARANGARTVLVNAEAPLNVDAFDEVHLGKAGEVLPELVNAWLAEETA
jgi:NAD-dependent SIR2 family protein deacetylase